jgi:inhibitor of growth protein 3
MPRDDLSIDFVGRQTMPPAGGNDGLDPAQILEEFLNRVQNLPEEIRFIQDEVADKDRQYDQCIRIIEDRDGRIQKWIKANGSHEPNPKEDSYRSTIRENYEKAEKLSDEKVALQLKLKRTYDKHLLHLDKQIKGLYDRNEPGFTTPDELPSLLRPKSPAQSVKQPGLPAGLRLAAPSVSTTVTPLTPIQNSAAQAAVRAANPQVRAAQQQSQPHTSASAPTSPAASHLLQRQVRESSAGPSGGASKRGPRVNSVLGAAPITSSGLARHSSLGPGTPKGHQTAAGVQRAGSAGPRAGVKSTNARLGRRGGTPSFGPGRKKGPGIGPGNKSTLSRVKRAGKNSNASGADSDLSDADSNSVEGSDAGTAGRSTPARGGSQSLEEHVHHPRGGPGGGRGGRPGRRSKKDRPPTASGEEDDEDGMDVDDDDAGDDTKKYCICRNVSYGDMVACDNTDDCPYEWFHWSCVGLKSEPTGTWYCPVCTEAFKKKGK